MKSVIASALFSAYVTAFEGMEPTMVGSTVIAPNTTTTVIQTPGLLRDPSKKAFFGTMGKCGNSALYQTYLSKGELYHCNMS